MKYYLRLAAWAARLLPPAVKNWFYRFPPLARILRQSLNKAAPGGLTEISIAAGNLAGFKMVLNLQTEKDYWLGTYEAELQAVLRELVQQGMVLYDIGANIGYISLMMARLSGKGGKIFSFEALPANLRRLKENISLNEMESVIQIHPKAVIDMTHPVRFLAHSSTSMGKAAGSAGRAEEYDQVIIVEGLALDDFVYRQKQPSPHIIKMDIEGGEVLAVKGMKRLLKERKPILLIELHGEEAARAVWDALTEAEYSIMEMRAGHPKLKSLDQLDWKAYIIAR
jgi:FkbM family methyltransferase